MRDGQGKFVKGGPGGPGRPRRETELEYLKAMREVVTIEDWQAICQAAVRDAKKGDAAARKWLGGYLVGVPEVKATALSEVPAKEFVLEMVEAMHEAD